MNPVSLWFLVTLLRCGHLAQNARARMAIAHGQDAWLEQLRKQYGEDGVVDWEGEL